MPTRKFVVFLYILFYGCSLKAQTADQIIAKYVAFIGGENHWKAVHSIVTSGTYNYGGVKFPFHAYSKAPNLYKFVVPFNGKYYEQVFNGKSGWKIDAFKKQTRRTVLTGNAARAMANEADVELESAIINYQNKGHTAILEGQDTIGGTPCFKIRFTRKNGDIETCFFSSDSFALVKKQAISKNEEMEGKLLDIFYSDYRKLNGIKIPFLSTFKNGDQPVLTITVDKAAINVPIATASFN